MKKVTFDELMRAVDYMSDHQYAFGDEIPEDMEYNGFIISFRSSCQFHQAVVSVADKEGSSGTLVYYDNHMPMRIHSGGKAYSPREYFIAYVNDEFNTLHPAPPDLNVYGHVNGKPVYSRDEFIYASRGTGPIESDEELLAYAEKATSHWQNAGWQRDFKDAYLDDDHVRRYVTLAELNRLKAMQQAAREAYKAAEAARNWHKVETLYWADNSIEEIWEDKDGARKTVMVEGPHGDACY